MSQVHQKGPVKPEMNITPLIDVVFLLIIFFMLVNKIVAEENVPMIVPKLTEPQTEPLGEKARVVVNLVPKDAFIRNKEVPVEGSGIASAIKIGAVKQFPLIPGKDGAPVDKQASLDAARGVLEEAVEANENITVVLRADASLKFAEVQQVLNVVMAAGVRSLDMAAFREND